MASKKKLKPVKKTAAKKPAAKAKPAAKSLKKPASKSVKKPVPAKKTAAKAKPAAKAVKKPVLKAAKKPVAKSASKPVKKPPVKGLKKTTKPAAKKPVSKSPVKKPAVSAKKPMTKKPAVAVKKPAAKVIAKKAIKPALKPVAKAPLKPVPVAKAPAKPELKKNELKTAPRKNQKSESKTQEPSKASAPLAVVKPRIKGNKAGYVMRAVPTENVIMQKSVRRVQLPPGYKPSEKEAYMNDFQLEYFRQKLLEERETLLKSTQETINDLKEEARDVGDEAERASRETENFFELRTRDRYRKLLYKIDKIIATIDDGTYGYCVDTGEEIGIKRLEGRPMAERTVDAQERWEHKKKQLGD